MVGGSGCCLIVTKAKRVENREDVYRDNESISRLFAREILYCRPSNRKAMIENRRYSCCH